MISSTATSNTKTTNRRRHRFLQCFGIFLAIVVFASTGLSSVPEAVAAPTDAPMVYKVQGKANRVDEAIDEIRLDFVLKVPHGYVDTTNGNLIVNNGVQLRVGYDYGNGTVRSTRYINTMSSAAGAFDWIRVYVLAIKSEQRN